MRNPFRRVNLERILSTFERTALDLADHIENKTVEAALLLEEKAQVEFDILANSKEVERAKRVLDRVKELVA